MCSPRDPVPAVVLVFALLASCSSSDPEPHPTGRDVGVRVLPAMCERASVCQPEAFAATWGAQSACITDLASLADPAAVDRPSACSSSEVDRCVADVRAISCTSFTTELRSSMGTAFPSTCSAC